MPASGHPVDTFKRENEALRGVVSRMREAMRAVLAADSEQAVRQPVMDWRVAWNELMDVEKQYQRKEHLLFSCLGRHGITAPSKVMWGKDDEIRAILKDPGTALRQREATLAEWDLLAAACYR